MIFRRSARRFRRLPGRVAADPFEGGAPEGLSLRVVRLEGGARRSPHRHPHSQEAIYVVSGAGVLWEDGVMHRFEGGDCALIEAGVPHATLPDPGTAMELVCFWPHPDLARNIEELTDTVVERDATRGSGAT